MDDMVSPAWNMATLFRIFSTGHLIQDPPPSPTLQFYVFKDFTSPNILLSYPTSSRLGIAQFTVPNKAPINFLAMIDTIQNSKTVIFSQQIEDITQKPQNSSDHKAKPIMKQHFQDHPSSVTPSQDYLLALFQDHKQSIAPFQDHKAHIVPSSQDYLTTADVRDIIAIKTHSQPVLTLQKICQESIPFMCTPQYPQYSTHTGKY